MKTFITCFFLLFTGWPSIIPKQVSAQTGTEKGWKIIATVPVKLTSDHSSVTVSRFYNRFSHIKFSVTGAPIRLVKTVIKYDKGSPDNIEILYDIPQGGESCVVDLMRVGQRKIVKIDFWYAARSVAKGKTASVTIFGLL